jgi:hypothetical protein
VSAGPPLGPGGADLFTVVFDHTALLALGAGTPVLSRLGAD